MASSAAQLDTLPVVVKEFSDNEVLEIAIIENIQREELNPIEEAHWVSTANGKVWEDAGTGVERSWKK